MSHTLPAASRRVGSLDGLFLRTMDALGIFLGLLVASFGWQLLYTDQYIIAGLTAVIMFFVAGGLFATYRQWRGARLINEITNIWVTWATALVGVTVAGAASQYGSGLTRMSFGIWALSSGIYFTLVRCLMRYLFNHLHEKGFNQRGFAVVGLTKIGIELAQNICDTPQLGLRLVGFFDDRPEARTESLPESMGQRLGDIKVLVEKARQGEIHNVYITFPLRAEDRIRSVLDALSDTTASVYVVPDFFVFKMLHSRWNNIQGIPVVSIFENPFYGIDGVLKRAFDLVVGTIILTVVAIPMMIIALLVKATSPGPVFFRQKRYGLDGVEIPVWKFRSMRVCEDGDQVKQATQGDSRITKVGAVLRKTSLDELPQLFNVIAGDMSLVGPRPHASAHNETYRKLIHGYMLRHKVKPGITGLAQVEGWRGETDTLEKMEKRIEFDHKYIREWNPWLDLKILFRTVWVVLKQENAY